MHRCIDAMTNSRIDVLKYWCIAFLRSYFLGPHSLKHGRFCRLQVRYRLAGQDTRLSPERPGFESRWRNIAQPRVGQGPQIRARRPPQQHWSNGRVVLGLEPRTTRNLSENHTTRQNSRGRPACQAPAPAGRKWLVREQIGAVVSVLGS